MSTRARLRKLVENNTPSEGIFYVVPNTDGSWSPFTYRFDEFPEIDHTEFWEKHVCPILAHRWAAKLKVPAEDLESELTLFPYAVPRGRVSRNAGFRFTVHYGNDLPAGVSKSTINRMFALATDTPWEKDDHEVTDPNDRAVISRTLRLSAAKSAKLPKVKVA